MADWNPVRTLSELDDFLCCFGHAHDGILKEVHWVNNDFVHADLTMSPYRLANLRMLVQRQVANLSAVEFKLFNVWEVHLDTTSFIFEGSARLDVSNEVLGVPRALLRLEFDASWFTFETMEWRDASEWMGDEVRFSW